MMRTFGVPPWAVVVVLAVGLSGCPRRIDFGRQGEVDDPEALLKLVTEAESQVFSINGESRVRVDTPEARGAFSMFAALSRPALIHLEPLDFFGRPQAVLVVNEGRFGLYQAQDNRYYTGPASPQNVSRFLPIALPAEELVQVMLGNAPRIPHERAELRSDEGCACYVLTLHRGTVRQELEVHPNRYRVLRSRVTGTEAYDLEFSDFAMKGERAFPRRVVLTAPSAKVRLELRYTDFTLNEAPDLTMFDLEPVEGAEVVDVDPSGMPLENVPPPRLPQLAPDTATD